MDAKYIVCFYDRSLRAYRALLLFIVVLVLLPALPCIGQEAGPVVHRLSWQSVEYASRYEVVIEIRTQTNTWVESTRRISENNTFVDVPLFLGSYRFRVGSYDLLGNPGSWSDWIYFEVIAGDIPRDGQPDIRQIPGDTVYVEPARRPAPEEEEKSMFRLEVLFQPLIILPFSDFNEIYATSPVQPLGFALRFSVMPFVTDYGVFGLELSPSWNYLANDILITSRYTHIINTSLSAVWQIRPFSRNSAINFRLGGGLVFLKSRFDFNQGIIIQQLDAWNPTMVAGVSYIYFLNKQFFLNTGIDYLHIFARDNRTLNYLRPYISFGWWI